MTRGKTLVIKPAVAEELLKHLKRAGHNELGEAHIANEDDVGKPNVYGDLVIDKPGCDYGLWLVDDPDLVDEEDAPRTQCAECTCGYSKLLNLFEPGEEDRARIEVNERRERAERAVHNQHQLRDWAAENGVEV